MSTPEQPETPEPGGADAQPSAPRPPIEPAQPWPSSPPAAAGYGPEGGASVPPTYVPPANHGQGYPPQQEYRAPDYSAPPGYEQAPGYAPPLKPQKTWMNITSLVTSILGLSLVGIVFGHLGLRASKRGEAELKGLGIAGLVVGYVGLVLQIIATIVVISLIASCANDPACVDFWSELETSN